jgi:hypothetical protein
MVLPKEMDNAKNFNLSKATVKTNYPTDKGKYIDIAIYDETIFIFIEVKINAPEKPKQQLSYYTAYSEKVNKSVGYVPVLFITPNGRESVDKKLSKDKYVRISFIENIIPWLNKCLQYAETKKSIKEILSQLITAIKSFCDVEVDIMKNEINKLVSSSAENYAAAVKIYEAIENNDLNYELKAREKFEGEIFKRVQAKFTDAKYDGSGIENWYYINIPLKNNLSLDINFDMEGFAVKSTSKKVSVIDKTKEIISTMNRITENSGEDVKSWDKGFIWASSEVNYLKLDDWVGKGHLYYYNLYQAYKKDPKSVADKIVKMAKELKNVLD